MDLAMTKDGYEIQAVIAVRGIPYFCLNCGSDLILARGKKNRPHFRHHSAKKRQEVLLCENYIKNQVNRKVTNSKIHEDELQTRSKVRLELCVNNGLWNLYLRFPTIDSKFHSLINRDDLYFQIYCEEDGHQFSSTNLLGLQGGHKVPVRIRNQYTVNVSDPILESQLQLNISGIYQPFENEYLLFKFIQGSLVHIPYKNVILNDRFFILTKKKLEFPKELNLIGTQKIEDYVLYELNMPNKDSPLLIDWFSRILKINVVSAKVHLDLVHPNVFRFSNGLIEVKDEKITVLITHKGSAPIVNWISIIGPDGEKNVFYTKERTIDIKLGQLGLYSIIILNQRGEMFEVRRSKNLHLTECKPLVLEENGRQMIFSQTEFNKHKLKISTNFTAIIYPNKGSPYELKRTSNIELSQVVRIHIPYIWSVKHHTVDEMEIIIPEMIKLLKKRSKYSEVYLGARRFQQMRDWVAKSSSPQKKHLLSLLNMRIGYVPSGVIDLLNELGDRN